MADKEKAAVSKNSKPSFWKGVKREWSKINWTKREDLVKQTGLVVVISLILGIIITVIDSGALKLIDLLMSI